MNKHTIEEDLEGIKVKFGRFQESFNMNIEYSKLSFFINDD